MSPSSPFSLENVQKKNTHTGHCLSFLLCHNSFIVNMNKIKGIKDLEFIMENDELVPISKRMLKEVKEQYINYLVGDYNENN